MVDDAGRPIEGLGPEQFELTVDGGPRRVVSAQFVAARAPGGTVPIRSHHFTTNQHDPGVRADWWDEI